MWFRKSKSPETCEAERAIQDANQTLDRVKSRDREVKDLSRASREFRRRNHFAHDLQQLFEHGGGRA